MTESKDTPRWRFIGWKKPADGNRILATLDEIDRKKVIKTVNLKNKGNEYCIAKVKRIEIMYLKLIFPDIIVEKV